MEGVRAIRTGAGAALLRRGLLVLTGRDRSDFLHHMTTQDIRRLTPGMGAFATAVTRQGKLVATLKVRVLEDEIRIDTDRPRQLREMLEAHIVTEDVTVRECDDLLVGVYGPRSRELLGLPELPPWGIHGAAMRVLLTGEDGYELWLPVGDPAFEGLIAAGVTPVSDDDLEIVRIEFGHPRWGTDMDETCIPVEVGLEELAISYTKGCYIGQEVIQRIRTYGQAKQQLRALVFDRGEPPPPGEPVIRDGERAGRVTSSTYSPTLDRPIALALLRRGHTDPGLRVSAAGREAEVRTLPLVNRA